MPNNPGVPRVVIVDFSDIPEADRERHTSGYPFKHGESMLLLGEIHNMPGHVAVVNKKGKIFWGYHDDNFREPTEDEV